MRTVRRGSDQIVRAVPQRVRSRPHHEQSERCRSPRDKCGKWNDGSVADGMIDVLAHLAWSDEQRSESQASGCGQEQGRVAAA